MSFPWSGLPPRGTRRPVAHEGGQRPPPRPESALASLDAMIKYGLVYPVGVLINVAPYVGNCEVMIEDGKHFSLE